MIKSPTKRQQSKIVAKIVQPFLYVLVDIQ